MNKVLVEGDTRRFLVINTPEYNGDNKYTVQEADLAGTMKLGFTGTVEQGLIEDLKVGDVLGHNNEFAPYTGVYVMRVA